MASLEGFRLIIGRLGIRLKKSRPEGRLSESTLSGGLNLPKFLQLLALEGLLFPVVDGRRLFEIFTLLPFADDAFFFDDAFKTLNGLLEDLIVVQMNAGYGNHPPLSMTRSFAGRHYRTHPGRVKKFTSNDFEGIDWHSLRSDFPVKVGPGDEAAGSRQGN